MCRNISLCISSVKIFTENHNLWQILNLKKLGKRWKILQRWNLHLCRYDSMTLETTCVRIAGITALLGPSLLGFIEVLLWKWAFKIFFFCKNGSLPGLWAHTLQNPWVAQPQLWAGRVASVMTPSPAHSFLVAGYVLSDLLLCVSVFLPLSARRWGIPMSWKHL